MKYNWHELLHEYHGTQNYKEIVKECMALVLSPEEALKIIEKKYGQCKKPIGVVGGIPHYFICGEIGTDIAVNAFDQFELAMSMLPVRRGALMPDAHYGYSMPIGGVIEYENAIFPAGVGYDIGCQVNLSIFDIPVEEMEMHRKEIIDIMIEYSYLGLGAARVGNQIKDHPIMDDPRWDDFTPYDLQKARAQLGTLGSGNHFADIVVVRHRTRPDDPAVGLLTHGGSRKTGYNIAKKYSKIAEKATKARYRDVPKGYGWLDMDTTAGQDYYNMMELMVGYACANHQIVHEEIARYLDAETVGVLGSIHNFAAEEKPNVFTHRKGATPLGADVLGLIPGTSGSNSYMVKGMGSNHFLNSSSHGAGRHCSRTDAKKSFDKVEFDAAMKDILYHGIPADEGVAAYKDIERVIQMQVNADILTVEASMEPRIVVMGGK